MHKLAHGRGQFVMLIATLFTVPWPAGIPVFASSPLTLADATPHYASYGTNQVYYLSVGRGPTTFVLVHCWAGNSGFWREQVPALADHARLILVDLPGHGKSDKPHTDYTLNYFAGGVLAAMRDARLEKAVLMGHSMGVAVICRVYSRAPDRIAALVAIDGLLRRPPIPQEQADQFRAAFSGSDYRTQTTNFIHSLFTQSGTEVLRDQVLSEILQTPQFVMSGAMDGMFGPGQPNWGLEKVDVPVLVLNAENPMWTEEYVDYVRSLSSASEYHVVTGVGHWLMLEKPAEFNAALSDMLRKAGLIGSDPDR